MASGKNRGGYNGGGTIMSPSDTGWFSKESTLPLPVDKVVAIPKRTAAEQAEYDAFVQKMNAPTLIKRADAIKPPRRPKR